MATMLTSTTTTTTKNNINYKLTLQTPRNALELKYVFTAYGQIWYWALPPGATPSHLNPSLPCVKWPRKYNQTKYFFSGEQPLYLERALCLLFFLLEQSPCAISDFNILCYCVLNGRKKWLTLLCTNVRIISTTFCWFHRTGFERKRIEDSNGWCVCRVVRL